MSFDISGFNEEVKGGEITIIVDSNHRLLKLARALPWPELLDLILPDIKRTSKGYWWRGRPLRLRGNYSPRIFRNI